MEMAKNMLTQSKCAEGNLSPWGLYCFSCGGLTIDEEFRLLGVEERKAYMAELSFGPADPIKQGHDNEGYFQRHFHYATL
jgi:hypothetical protein